VKHLDVHALLRFQANKRRKLVRTLITTARGWLLPAVRVNSVDQWESIWLSQKQVSACARL